MHQRINLGHGARGLDAAHSRHGQIDHDYVGPEFFELSYSGPPVFGLAADLPFARFQNRANDAACCSRVLYHQDAEIHDSSLRAFINTRVPLPRNVPFTIQSDRPAALTLPRVSASA